MSKGAPNVRYAEIDRETSRTKVHLVLDLEGGTRRDVSTGIAIFDELLCDVAKYASLDLGISVESDPNTDDNHIIEDVGVAFGQAVRACLEDSDPVAGTGSCIVPSSEALVLCALDLHGRRHLGWRVEFRRDWIGAMATENVQQFFETVSDHAEMSLHFQTLAGQNDVHLCEAAFRAFARSLHAGTRKAERRNHSK